jgi:hypothetical protein
MKIFFSSDIVLKKNGYKNTENFRTIPKKHWGKHAKTGKLNEREYLNLNPTSDRDMKERGCTLF